MSKKLKNCQNIALMGENDLLEELEKKINIHTENEAIESFMKENLGQGEVYGIYRLKTRVMFEKIDKMR